MSFLPGIAQLVKKQYAEAVKDPQDGVVFTESEVLELDDEERDIPFEVRYCPALAKKPTTETPKDAKADSDKPKDPFAPPYQPLLYVAEGKIKEDEQDAGDSFVILLNKFCVMPRHFLMVTKDFRPQSAPVIPSELAAAYSIVKQLASREKHLAFFNCGPESGASQPHRHWQFLPLSNGQSPLDSFINSNKPQDEKLPFTLPLPFANFVGLLDQPSSGRLASPHVYLGNIFMALLDLMIDHLRRLAAEPGSAFEQLRLSQISYNILLTRDWIMLVPRTKEKAEVEGAGEPISINSLGFAGMVLVKSEAQLEAVKKTGVLSLLEQIGYPPVLPGEIPEETPLE